MNIQQLIWGLEELSLETDLQLKMWTGGIEGEMHSFVEAICSTFDDSGLGRLLDLDRGTDQLPPEVLEKAKRLRILISRVPQSGDPVDMVQHPRMKEVRTLSGELLALVKKKYHSNE